MLIGIGFINLRTCIEYVIINRRRVLSFWNFTLYPLWRLFLNLKKVRGDPLFFFLFNVRFNHQFSVYFYAWIRFLLFLQLRFFGHLQSFSYHTINSDWRFFQNFSSFSSSCNNAMLFWDNWENLFRKVLEHNSAYFKKTVLFIPLNEHLVKFMLLSKLLNWFFCTN